METQKTPSLAVSRQPKTRKFRNEKGIANQGSYRETLEDSVAMNLWTRSLVAIPKGSAVSTTSGGFDSAINATCVRGNLWVAGKETPIAFIA